MVTEAEKKLAHESELVVSLLLGPDGKDFMVNIDDPPPAGFLPSGCRYVGTLGICCGIVEAVPANYEPDTVRAVISAVAPFLEYAKTKLQSKGDSVDWLKELFALPDTRMN